MMLRKKWGADVAWQLRFTKNVIHFHNHHFFSGDRHGAEALGFEISHSQKQPEVDTGM